MLAKPTEGSEPLLSVQSVTKTFGDSSGETVLSDVSFDVNAGDFVGIVGPSGSGKSTLLNILGLLDVPSNGSYLVDSEDTLRCTDAGRAKIRAKSFGFVFQSFHLVPYLRVSENIGLGLAYRGEPAVKRREEVLTIAEQLGITHRIDAFPQSLSGGERQRVAIARAIVKRPSVLFCDEPTGSLDSKNTMKVMDMLASLNESGLTIVNVTHDLSVAGYMGRLLKVDDGKVTHG